MITHPIIFPLISSKYNYYFTWIGEKTGFYRGKMAVERTEDFGSESQKELLVISGSINKTFL